MRLSHALPVAVLLVAAACRQEPVPRPPGTQEGQPREGAAAIDAYGCGACHTIPGIEGADSLVGPPLVSWSERSFIAGMLPNDQENLVRWIRDPDEIRPGTAMPDLGVTSADARNIAAYLLSLE